MIQSGISLTNNRKRRGPSTDPCGTPLTTTDQEEGYWTTRGYANSQTANSRTGRLADWTSGGLVNSRTRQLAYWTSRGLDKSQMPPVTACLVFVLLAASARLPVVQSATCPVCELTSPRDVQSASWQSASWRIRELSSYQEEYCPFTITRINLLDKEDPIHFIRPAPNPRHSSIVSNR